MAVKTRSVLKAENSADFPDNNARLISPAHLRGQMDDVVDSMLMDEDMGTLPAGPEGPEGPQGPQGPPGGAEGYSTKIVLMDRMDTAQQALVATTGPYIDDLWATIVGELTASGNGAGGEIVFPRGTVRFANTVYIRKRLKLTGESPGQSGQLTSSIIFDDNQDGFVVNSSSNSPTGLPDGVNTQGNATSFDSLGISPANNPLASNKRGSGIRSRANITIKHCNSSGWAEHGLVMVGSTTTTLPHEYGNVDTSYVENSRFGQNRSHGIYIDGNNANACTFVACDCSNNVGCGVFDSGFLGNSFIGHHCANNQGGAYRTDDANNQSTFIACYSEGDSKSSVVIAGNLAVGGTFGAGWLTPTDITAPLIGSGNNITPIEITEISAFPKKLGLNLPGNSALDVILGGSDTGEPTGGILDQSGMSFAYLDPFKKELSWRYNNSTAGDDPIRLTTYYSDNEGEAVVSTSAVWAGSTIYVVGDLRHNADTGITYRCVVAGTSHATVKPTGTGTGIVDGTVTWDCVEWLPDTMYAVGQVRFHNSKAYICTLTGRSAGAALWQPSTVYQIHDQVLSGAHPQRLYKCTVGGTSAAAPAAWNVATPYVVGNAVTSGGNVYKCDVAGTGGPAPTGTGINIGTAPRWDYVGDGGPAVALVESTGVTWASVIINTVPWASGTTYWHGDYVCNPLPPLWQRSTAYAVDDLVSSQGQFFICTTAGTSSTTGFGPTVTTAASAIVDATVRWSFYPEYTRTYLADMPVAPYFGVSAEHPAWQPDTFYNVASTVTNDSGRRYKVREQRGVSGETGIAYPAWTPSTAYRIGSMATNDGGKIYKAVVAGTSAAAGGPTGIGAAGVPYTNIVDGSVQWRHWIPGPFGTGTLHAYTGTGRKIYDNTVDPHSASYAWTPSVAPSPTGDSRYTVGMTVHHRGRTYICAQAGVAGTNTPWAVNTSYTVGSIRLNDGSKVYECITTGTSAASGGPTGTALDITDGTAHWKYLYTLTVPPGPYGSQDGAVDGTVIWNSPGGDMGDGPGTEHFKSGIIWDYIPIPGPTGTLNNTIDGTVSWDIQPGSASTHVPYITTGPAGTKRAQIDGSTKWDFISVGIGRLILDNIYVPVQGNSKFTQMNLRPVLRHLQAQYLSHGQVFTLTPGLSPHKTHYDGAMTADRAVTLATIGVSPDIARAGTSYKITRTATGAFNLNLGTATGVAAWLANTSYVVGDQRTNGGNVYICTQTGRSAGNPAWAATTAYAVVHTTATPSVVTSGVNTYRCLVAGTSGAVAPSGTGTGSIVDGATILWEYVGPTGVTTGPAGTGTGIQDGTCVWAYQVVPLKALAVNTWGEVTFNGNAWYLSAYGAL